ncbi:MAG TPA: serine hydrolase domain-containing protein [Candidatus Cybelea sp.]|nr:serine hydrolase domain-containing protein [Candidatus Cybelea sp.]
MTRSSRFGVAICVLALWLDGICGAAATANDAARSRTVDQTLDNVIAWKLTPSIAMAVVQGDKIAYTATRGMADLERRQTATAETRYAIGSLGSLFIMVGIMQLSAQGRVRLNDSVRRYLPEESPMDVTLREMLASRDDGAYTALGGVIERITGEPLLTYLTDHVFRPAGMTQTWLGEPPSWLPLATRYYEWRNDFGVADAESDAWSQKCCSAVSTATDLARFDIALFNSTLLSQGSLRAIEPFFQAMQKAGILMIGRQGSAAGFDAQNILLPQQRFAIVILANCAGFAAPAVLDRALGLYYPTLANASGNVDPNPAITSRLQNYLTRQSPAPAGTMSFLSSSESAGSTEYRYLVDVGGAMKSAFFVLDSKGNVNGFWLH